VDYVCVILGGGGHARVLIDCLQAIGRVQLHGILDPDRCRWGQTIWGIPILGGDDLLVEAVASGVNCFAVGLGGTGDNSPRGRLFKFALSYGLEPLTIIHPTAMVSRWAKVGDGSQLMPGSIVNAGAELGINVIINSGAIVEHDCLIGNHIHVSTGAKLSSAVRVGDGAHIGAGATVRQCIAVGENAIVGAGAVVVEDVSPGVVVAGVPARQLRGVGAQWKSAKQIQKR
jgi:sugar O-acyltransferase (sialic acid O-acetyltransferase NeuD family)